MVLWKVSLASDIFTLSLLKVVTVVLTQSASEHEYTIHHHFWPYYMYVTFSQKIIIVKVTENNTRTHRSQLRLNITAKQNSKNPN